MPVYVIKNWDEHYENNRSKEIKNPSWVPIPNKLYGDGYTMIMEHKNGPAIYGAWIALVCIAQKCDVRGTLVRSCGEPHNVDSISRITRIDKIIVEAMVNFTIYKTKWLIIKDLQSGAVISHKGAAIPHKPTLIQKDTEQKDTEQKDTERDLNISFKTFWDLYDKKVGKRIKIEKKWNKLNDDTRQLIIDRIPDYINSQPNKKYRKNPETYLNNESWNDEVICNGCRDKQNDKYVLPVGDYPDEKM